VPGERNFLLYVLGRSAKDQRSAPADLLPFLREHWHHIRIYELRDNPDMQ